MGHPVEYQLPGEGIWSEDLPPLNDFTLLMQGENYFFAGSERSGVEFHGILDVRIVGDAPGENRISIESNSDVELTNFTGLKEGQTAGIYLQDNCSVSFRGDTFDAASLGLTEFSFSSGPSLIKYTALEGAPDLSLFPRISEQAPMGPESTLQIVQENADGSVSSATRVEFADGVLTAYNGDVPIARFGMPGVPEDTRFEVEPDGSVSFACFLRGTLIATPQGDKPVETLQCGDLVSLHRGGATAIKWIGTRRLRKNWIPPGQAPRAFPIRFAAGSLGPDMPKRELALSPGHHLYINGKLVAAYLLVNGTTIAQDDSLAVFEYFHIELESFDILIAEGVPVESYVDTGNRAMFENCPEHLKGRPGSRPKTAGMAILRDGPLLDEMRERIGQGLPIYEVEAALSLG